ncbi:hypothetical protein V8E53_006880 [Lactarius tabidus]
MVPSAGYHMPLVYGGVSQGPYSISLSSNEVSDASTVASHQNVDAVYPYPLEQKTFSFRGATATYFPEWLTPSSLSTLEPYTSTLSVLLNEKGGIINDMTVIKHASDTSYFVTNAARGARKTWRGPAAADHLQALTSYDLRALTFGRSAFVPLEGINVHIARGGVHGFVSLSHMSPSLHPHSSAVQLAGLGAQDAKVLALETSDEIGVATPAIPLAPTVGKNISKAYVKSGFHEKGTPLAVEVRKKARRAVVTPLPFTASRYGRGRSGNRPLLEKM